MFPFSNRQQHISRAIGLGFLLLCFLPSSILAECTDGELRVWRQGDGWKAGALIWAGSDNIPVYTEPNKDAFKEEYLKFNDPALPIQDKKGRGRNIWVQVRRANEQVWIRAREPGVLCRSTPLEAEHSQLLRKVVPRVENREGKEPFVPARLRPKDAQGVIRQNIRIFDYFFVYAEQGDWRLLGRGDFLDAFEPRLLGWVHEKDLIRWDTRNVAKPKPQARFLADPHGERKPIAWSTGDAWGTSTRRPPITGTRMADKQRYLRVVLPVDFVAHRRHSDNLRRLARAEGAWRQPIIVFLVDGTHSTEPYLAEIHALLNSLLNDLEREGRNRNLTLRYALYAYTDAAYGPGYHTRRYQGATENTWSIRRAFGLLEKDTRKILANPVSDDYPEDIYAGIRRVREEVLTSRKLQAALPILIVIGDHGSHERKILRSTIRSRLKDIVPYFIQMGRQDGHVSPDCRTPAEFNQREKRYCAFQRFEEDAKDLLGARFEENITFFRGEDPKRLARQVQGVLEDILTQQGRTPLAVDSLATGQSWEEAKRAAEWPLVYTQAFRNLLLAQGYDEAVLDSGDFVAVQETWVLDEEIVPEIFITRPDLSRWINLFERMARSENWNAQRVKEIFASSIGVYTKEKSLWRRPLAEVFEKRAGIPFRNTALLEITPEQIDSLAREDVRYYASLFARFREVLDGIYRGELSEIGTGYYGGTKKELITIRKPTPADLWFEFAPGIEAAYIELRHLP